MAEYTRVARTAASTLEHTFEVDEQLVDSSTQVTVSVTDANGDVVNSGNATSAGPDTGRYTFPLPGQAQLQLLTVLWTGTINDTEVTETDYVEIVGGFFFGLIAARGSDASLANEDTYTTAQLALARLETEVECEEICDRAFVPRYRRVELDGTGTRDLVLPDTDLRTVRTAKIAPAPGQDPVALTAAERASLKLVGDRILRRTDDRDWTWGTSNVVLEYEHGLDAPPPGLRRAALVRFRSRLNIHRTGVPDRAVSFQPAEGGTFRIDLPGAWKTGIPDVDAVYARYSKRAGAGTGNGGRGIPASRSMNFDPQHGSLFHGGVR